MKKQTKEEKQIKTKQVEVFTCKACGQESEGSDIIKLWHELDAYEPYSHSYDNHNSPFQVDVYVCKHCGTLRANGWRLEEHCLEYRTEEIK